MENEYVQLLIRNKKPIIIIVILIALGFAIYWAYFLIFTLYITSVSPNLNSPISSLEPTLTVSYNKPLKDQAVQVSSPADIKTTASVSKGKLVIALYGDMDVNNNYEIDVASVTSTDGKVLKKSVIKFSTNSDVNLKGSALQTVLDRQEAAKAASRKIYADPVYKATPYTGSNFLIKSTVNPGNNGEGSISVAIYIYLDPSDEGANRQSVIDAAKASAIAYLNGIQGFDPAKYALSYTVQDPGA